MAAFSRQCQGVIAIDGKVLRRSHDRARGKSALHMVSAWGCQQRMVLGQIATDEKSNEITAVPKLLAMLSLKGTIVTVDALNCQRTIAQQIVGQGGNYALALKANQATLHDDVRLFLDDPARSGGVTARTGGSRPAPPAFQPISAGSRTIMIGRVSKPSARWTGFAKRRAKPHARQ